MTLQVGVSVAVDLIMTAPCHRMNCSDSGGDVHGTINWISNISPCPQIQVIEFPGYGMDAVMHCVKFPRLPFVECGGHWIFSKY